VALGLLVGVTGQATAQPSYTFSTLDVPGSSYASTFAQGINDSGQIVGWYVDAGGRHGFLLDNGTYTTLDPSGSIRTEAYGINNAGKIVGSYTDAAVHWHCFLLDQGSYTTLDLSQAGPYPQAAQGINDSGQIVGWYYDPLALTDNGFLLDNGTYTAFDPSGSISNDFYGINASGQIAGLSEAGAFLFENGNYTLFDVPGAPTGINDSGQIVGSYGEAAGIGHGFVYDQGSYTTLDVPDSTATYATGINASGQIVGYYYDAVGTHGFLATPVP
jgi:probable HAF family extracellular repeat protein